MNISRAKRVLSTLQVHLASLDVSGYKSFLVNPEASNHGILFKKVDSLKNKKNENSFLYSLFQGSEDFESYVIGFLSSHSSRNYIKFIRNNNKINIYAINNGELGESPLKSIPLKDGEMVIMAEWASGSYVENWESSFISNIKK